jgi:hypothetical protein
VYGEMLLMLTNTRRKGKRKDRTTVVLKTRAETAAYVAAHCKPVGRSPKGRMIYSYEDLKKLDIQYPDQKK